MGPSLGIGTLAALLLSLFLQSSDAAKPQSADALPADASSPVIVDGVELFRVVGATSLPSEQRAQGMHERIIDVARDRTIPVSGISVVRREERFDVLSGTRHLVSVVEAEAKFEGAPAVVVAELRAERIREAIIGYRAHRTPQHLGRAALVSIGYETPWRQVEAILLSAAARTDNVLQERPPFVLVKALGDFAVTYEINVYVDGSQDILQSYAALHRNILDAFNEHDVQVMTPAYESDPAQPKIVPKERWFAAPAQRTSDAAIAPLPAARNS